MPTRPDILVMTNTSDAVLNAIRNSASVNYQEHVPIATADAESVKAIGAVIMDNVNLQNEFLNALINRIARVVVTSKSYENPWNMFKKGFIEMGETVEEIFIDLIKPFQYDPAVAENELFKREKPDVKSAFHYINYQKFYKVTIERQTLRKAFLTYDGVTDLITDITKQLYTSMNYDEFQSMKYMLAVTLLNGFVKTIPFDIRGTTDTGAIMFKATSDLFTFMNTDYNPVGVHTLTEKNEQYLIVNSIYNAKMDVDTLATAFNMSKAEFMGHRVVVDSFGKLDIERLAVLFADDPNYIEIGEDEIKLLDKIPAVLVDENWFQIYDNLLQFTDVENAQGLYWNYFLHAWKTFSVSPFSQAVAFVSGDPAITSVTVTPDALTIKKGAKAQLSAEVVTTNFASKAVNWTSSNTAVTVDSAGNVSVGQEASGSVTITATSVVDSSKKDTCTLTIS